jgi:EAL domain-containing protein (putative c-di-GMP-specific phosphodiesterase class I)
MVKGALFHSGLEPHLLELEITETALVGDVELAISTLEKLKELGIEIAIDDFGTGHSSMNYLKKFPVDRLKIDKSFVDNAHTDPQDLAIVDAILTMASAFDIDTIAEGIEYPEQVNVLKSKQCMEGQGYHFSKPLSVREFEAFMMKHFKDRVSA